MTRKLDMKKVMYRSDAKKDAQCIVQPMFLRLYPIPGGAGPV